MTQSTFELFKLAARLFFCEVQKPHEKHGNVC